MSSGIVLNDDIRWITFCGIGDFSERLPSQGRSDGALPLSQLSEDTPNAPWIAFCGMYDFAYMLQLLTSEALPEDTQGFQESLDLFFPSRCDVGRHIGNLPGQGGLTTNGSQ